METSIILLLEYYPKGSTVTSASYFNTLIHLQKAIKGKHSDLLKWKVNLHGTTPLLIQ